MPSHNSSYALCRGNYWLWRCWLDIYKWVGFGLLLWRTLLYWSWWFLLRWTIGLFQLFGFLYIIWLRLCATARIERFLVNALNWGNPGSWNKPNSGRPKRRVVRVDLFLFPLKVRCDYITTFFRLHLTEIRTNSFFKLKLSYAKCKIEYFAKNLMLGNFLGDDFRKANLRKTRNKIKLIKHYRLSWQIFQ